MNDDGTFVLSNASTKFKKEFDEKSLLQVLKEVTFQFRGKYPNLTVAGVAYGEPQVATQAVSLSSREVDEADIVQTHYNGGLGGAIAPEKNLNGFGEVD